MDGADFRSRFLSTLGAKTKMKTWQIAKLVGVHEMTIYNYMRGERIPNAKTLRNICAVLDVSADYLIGLSDDMEIHR